MGQKVNPIGFRLGINRTWDSRWYAGKEYGTLLHEDVKIREYIEKALAQAGVARIVIERPAKRARITIHTARPGVVIGKKGADIEKLRQDLSKMTGGDVTLNIVEIRKPELDAAIVGETIAKQLEARINYRRAIKNAISQTMRVGAEGIKVRISGRLAGSEMARTEEYKEGRTPLHTFRSDIDYALSEALTVYGIIGIKVWICKGEVFGRRELSLNAGFDKREKGGRGGGRSGGGRGGERRGGGGRRR